MIRRTIHFNVSARSASAPSRRAFSVGFFWGIGIRSLWLALVDYPRPPLGKGKAAKTAHRATGAHCARQKRATESRPKRRLNGSLQPFIHGRVRLDSRGLVKQQAQKLGVSQRFLLVIRPFRAEKLSRQFRPPKKRELYR